MSLRQAVDIETVRDRVTEYLSNKYEVNDERKYRAYYMSQSFNQLFEDIDPESVVSLSAKTKQTVDSTSVQTPHSYTSQVDYERRKYSISYESGVGVDTIDVSGIQDEIEALSLRDVPVQSVTIRLDDDEVYDYLYDILDVVGVRDMSAFEQPLYATLESTTVRIDSVREWMNDHHPVKYFSRPQLMNDGPIRGLGWNYQTLDLESIYSRNAWIEDSATVMHTDDGERLTMRDLEDAIFNYHQIKDDNIAPVNSRLVTRALRNAVCMGRTGTKGIRWDSVSGWDVSEEVSE